MGKGEDRVERREEPAPNGATKREGGAGGAPIPSVRPLIVGTGLTRGIGRALVEALGSQVTWISLQREQGAPEPSRPVAPPAAEGEVEILPWDLAATPTPSRSRALLDALQGRPVWGLVHCAGVLGPIGSPTSPGTQSPQATSETLVDFLRGFEEALRVNTTAVAELFETLVDARAFGPRASDGRPPFVLHLSSGAALSPYQGWEAYCASKAATRMLFRAWAARFAAHELVVASIAPGTVSTDMMKTVLASSPDVFPAVGKFHALASQGGLVAPEVPARHIAGLLLGEASTYASLHGAFYDVRKGLVPGV